MADYDKFDEVFHPRNSPSQFSSNLQKTISRRQFISVTTTLGTLPFILATGCSSQATHPEQAVESDNPTLPETLFGFEPVKSSTEDTIKLPPGYRWNKLISWGDRLFSSSNSFTQLDGFSSDDQAAAFGDNNDGMQFFAIDETHAVLTVNNEYIARWAFYDIESAPTAEEVQKALNAHGVSIFDIEKHEGEWQLQLDGIHNRRITASSPMSFSGPAAGHALLQTTDNPDGNQSLGTWANCGCSKTPWGTYLTCEENFNAYFGSDNKDLVINSSMRRYGLSANDWGLHWYKFHDRFDLNKEPNEANRVGWVVEIDPSDPNSVPQKHTALGRFKHENAELAIADTGQLVVYMGDDERGEFIYRFVSKGTFNKNELDVNTSLLEEGTLYAARFDANEGELSGTGQWLKLAMGENGIGPESGFPDQATVQIFARMAASVAGATTMDRPEWIASHPHKAEVYCALTNNKYRGERTNAGGDKTPIGGPNPRPNNLYGQIVRWRPSNGDHVADSFEWDLFALAGNPVVHTDADSLNAGSANIDTNNMFNSPDGLAIDHRGILWIQTDGDFKNEGDFAGMGNNQMLAANPQTGEIRRFMVGPRGCEMAGLCWSDDGKTMFVGVQHPGDHNSGSNFPDGEGNSPRSTVVTIVRADGGLIGG